MTWQGFAALVVILLGSGGGGVLLVVRMVRQNDVIKLALERLYLSTPPETQKRVRSGVEILKEATDLLDEVTDGVLTQEEQAQANKLKVKASALGAP